MESISLLSAQKPYQDNQRLSDESDTPASGIQFFSIPLTRLIWLSFLTLGFYIIYWFYRNWVAIKEAEKRNIWPLWRSLFSIFFVYSLFKKINQSIKTHSPNHQFGYSFLAFLYIAFFLLQKFGFIFFDLIPLFFAQKAINFNNHQINPAIATTKKLATAEKILVVLGSILWLLVVVYATFKV